MRKVFIEDLPKRTYGEGSRFLWEKMCQEKLEVSFIYEDINGKVKIIDYEKKGQKLTIEYNNVEFSMKTNEFLKCAFGSLLNKLNKTIIQGVNDIYTQETWMVKYFFNPEEAKLYSKGMHKKIKVICPICNNIKDTKVSIFNLYRYKSIGCKKCGDGISYPNKFMFNLLHQLNIDFETEYTPSWMNNKMRYDFYIPSYGLIIEMDGLRHFQDEKIQQGDKYKDKMAIQNQVIIVRINCKNSDLNYIKNNIMNSRLSHIFNLNNVDWLKIEEFCLSSRVKEVCDLWKIEKYNTMEIVSLTGLCKTTVCRYLNQGSRIGWCDYDGKIEKLKNWSKAGVKTSEIKSKKVEIFKDGKSLGIFKSCKELERESEKLFGLKLNNKSISRVCNGGRKTYKGFVFMHVLK